ncbi:MAG: transcriptional repressor LexA [bacterium]|nr:transcriptional repressor LexA [bacterium]
MSTYEQRKNKITNFYTKHKRLPSYSEMLELFSLKSKNAVARIVQKLIEQEIVEKDNTNRLIPGKLLGGVRKLGTVEAGWPSPAEEELADAISLDEYLIENKEASFLLTVSGESMIGVGINPDDLVIVERGKPPRSGDIVVAEVDGEWTIKTYEKHGDNIRLLPANSKFKPIIPRESLHIAGVVTAVVRKYK